MTNNKNINNNNNDKVTTTISNYDKYLPIVTNLNTTLLLRKYRFFAPGEGVCAGTPRPDLGSIQIHHELDISEKTVPPRMLQDRVLFPCTRIWGPSGPGGGQVVMSCPSSGQPGG